MEVTFDSAKDEGNLAKHGISLSRAVDMEMAAVIEDRRFDYGEARYRAFGMIDGKAHCLAFVVRSDGVRAISLRRAHLKELRRHVRQAKGT